MNEVKGRRGNLGQPSVVLTLLRFARNVLKEMKVT
jgi:hypothetical protein